MMGRNHILTGVAGWVLVAPWIAHTPAEVVLGGVVLAGSTLIPDIDHPGSTISRAHPVAQAISGWASEYGHREWTHSLLFAALMGGATLWPAVWLGVWWLALLVAAGCVLHVAGDWLTMSGVPWLWPQQRKWGLRLFYVGEPFERVGVTLLLAAGVVALVWWRMGMPR